MTHRLDAGADTAHWGYFDATLAPRTTVDSGGRITISTVSGGLDVLPPADWGIPPGLSAIHQRFGGPPLPGHISTRPVAVKGAKVEPSVGADPIGSRYQFERTGYFISDPDSTPNALVFNRTVTLKDSWEKVKGKA